MATQFAEYRDKYRFLDLQRTPEGVLTATFHTDGGPHIHNGEAHTEFTHAFTDIAMDDGNEVVILTGAGRFWYQKMDFSAVGELGTSMRSAASSPIWPAPKQPSSTRCCASTAASSARSCDEEAFR